MCVQTVLFCEVCDASVPRTSPCAAGKSMPLQRGRDGMLVDTARGCENFKEVRESFIHEKCKAANDKSRWSFLGNMFKLGKHYKASKNTKLIKQNQVDNKDSQADNRGNGGQLKEKPVAMLARSRSMMAPKAVVGAEDIDDLPKKHKRRPLSMMLFTKETTAKDEEETVGSQYESYGPNPKGDPPHLPTRLIAREYLNGTFQDNDGEQAETLKEFLEGSGILNRDPRSVARNEDDWYGDQWSD